MAAKKQYPLRVDPALWSAVQRWADDELRSVNGQMEFIIRDALRRAGRLPEHTATGHTNARRSQNSAERQHTSPGKPSSEPSGKTPGKPSDA
ncbi:hypothetical protein [Bifidobacterium mongoliense]|jgi:hypothetical protein|uniref:hypothetical protein n=1 Tax=Bifidobacterium mongoliense TaxID=518643 RepID=UPI0030EE5A8D